MIHPNRLVVFAVASSFVAMKGADNVAKKAEIEAQMGQLKSRIQEYEAKYGHSGIQAMRIELENLQAQYERIPDTPPDLAKLPILGGVQCNLDDLTGLSPAQTKTLKDWRLIRLAEWNAEVRLRLARTRDKLDEENSIIDFRWFLVRKDHGVTSVCCSVDFIVNGSSPEGHLYAFNFVDGSATLLPSGRLFSYDKVEKLRTVILRHRKDALKKVEMKLADLDPLVGKHPRKPDADEANVVRTLPFPGSPETNSAETGKAVDTPATISMWQLEADRIDAYNLTEIAITPTGLLFCFDQGAIWPFSAGALAIPVPYDEVKELLTPEAGRFFQKH